MPTEWLIPTGLIALSLLPAAAGIFRLSQLAGGAEITPENARFFASPVPIVLHLISVVIYSILGAFQFTPGFRRRRRGWHRVAGWVLIPAGLITALSGLWMSHFYALPSYDGELLYWIRMVVGWAMFFFIILGAVAIRQRDYAQHGAWMMRGYALGVGAGTQVLTLGPWIFFYGMPDEFPRAILMATAWIINLAVAEWVIARKRSRRTNIALGTRQ